MRAGTEVEDSPHAPHLTDGPADLAVGGVTPLDLRAITSACIESMMTDMFST